MPKSKMSVINKEHLIECVRNRRPLWDRKDPAYSNRRKEVLWEEIAAELENDVATLKKTWENIRDCYRRELKRILKTPSGNEAVACKPKWSFFERCNFLKDSMQQRETVSNLDVTSLEELDFSDRFESSVVEERIISAENDNNSQTHQQEQQFFESCYDLSSLSTASNSSMRRRRKSSQNLVLELEEKKLMLFEEQIKLTKSNIENIKEDEKDEDRLFLLSLLPSLKKIEESKKLLFRIKVLELVNQYLNDPTV